MHVLDHPFYVFTLTFVILWLASLAGIWLRDRRALAGGSRNEDFDLILAATLTLLALIIGFSFSMATNRYDQRKNYEEAEANAIGTEYVRADLLPPADAANVRKLLGVYLDQRIDFYNNDDDAERARINQRTNQLETQLWAAVLAPASAHPTPVTGLVVAGMNDVLNSSDYTQAAMWNRIPIAAWALMAAIAICCNVMLGYGSRSTRVGGFLAFVLPLVVAISFLLIADIDAPRHGLIRVIPQNLQVLDKSLPH